MSGFQELKEGKSNAQVARTESGTRPSLSGSYHKIDKDVSVNQELLNFLLEYRPDTGELIWKVSVSKRVKKGSRAGSMGNNGYPQIRLGGKLYQSHRLIWMMVYGYFPEHQVDHINRVRSDNRLNNLREVAQICNLRNASLSAANTSGVKGICFDSKRGKYLSHITIATKFKQLAWVEDLTEAVAHRLAAEQCLDWAECDSSSSAYQFMQNYLKEVKCLS